MSLGNQIVYKQLFQRHGRVQIPMIQRDYAQGRPSESDVREEFLNTLEEALRKPSDDPTLPLNLDFVYGSVEGDDKSRFLPLDGQQRLTTLFLLHWYLAWQDEQWEVFDQLFKTDQRSRFAYSVRPSSNEFFDEFVSYRPTDVPDSVQNLKQLISDQPWYFRSWRLDPTIQSVLCMLDAIHDRFASSEGLFNRLINEEQPVITFQLLDLENFGLSDDLYIKMNARGKPLTEFENFKARYEQELEKQFEGILFGEQNFPVARYVALRMDTAWTDLVWRLRDKKSNLYDGALTNIFRAVALVTRSPDHDEYLIDFSLLRNGLKAPSYTDFHSHGWLDERFTLAIIHLLDAWCMESGTLSTLLPDQRYFDERAIFDKIVLNGANLSFVEIIQFAAYAAFIAKHQDVINAKAFQEWMRIVCNLSENTDYNRPDDLRRSIIGLNVLLEHTEDILEHFAYSDNPVNGFSAQQILEEELKAELILADEDWKVLIDRAEGHGYFLGQIEFLLDFSGVVATRLDSDPSSWAKAHHTSMEQSFLRYLRLAEEMFTIDGLKHLGRFLWQRALLSVGDYLLPSRRNYSFLVNRKDDQASWKRLLRGTGDKVPGARKILNKLWDKLNPDQPLDSQLERVIDEATEIEPWRAKLAQTPKAIEYCENQSIRWNSATEIYLLSKTQMNGSYAELFTFSLYHSSLVELDKADRMQPLSLAPYYSPVDTDVEPGIQLFFEHGENAAYFDLEFNGSQYKLFVRRQHLEKWPDLFSWLIVLGFSEVAGTATMFVCFEDIEDAIIELAQDLSVAFSSS